MLLQKPDNILRQINRRIDQVVNVFGMKSPEYMDIKAILNTISGVDSITNVGEKGKPDKMSRAKRVQSAITENPVLHEDLQNAWNAIKARGTITQMKRKYLPSNPKDLREFISSVEPEVLDEGIKEAARKEYESKYDDDDIYEKMQELAEEVAEMGDGELIQDVEDIRMMFGVKTGKGNKAAQDDKYNTLKQFINQLERDIVNKELDVDYEEDDDDVYGNFDMSM